MTQPAHWGTTGPKVGQPTGSGGSTPPPSVSSPAPSTRSLTDVLTTADPKSRDAYASLLAVLKQWDLETLAPQVLKFIQQGWQSDAITSVLLPDTAEYKKRFAGNDARIKAGLAPLSPLEYISTERAYRQVLQASGLPATFYNSPDDYAKLIGADISASELQDRSKNAFKYVNEELGGGQPGVAQAWQDFYGIDAAHMAAHFLDATAAQASLDRQANAVDIAAAAARNGLSQPGRARAEQFADQGVTGAAAQDAYRQIGNILPDTQNEAARFGADYNQGTAEDEFLGGLASAQRRRESLNRQEQSLWAGNSPQQGPALGGLTGGAY